MDQAGHPPASAKPVAGEMARRVREADWSSTALGPRETWSRTLSLAHDIVMTSGFPMALRWGPNFILIYNDGYAKMLGDKHPWALGRPAQEVWPEVWDQIGPMHVSILSGASPAVFAQDMLLRLKRFGETTQDAWMTFSYSPIQDEESADGVGGVFVTAVETTARVKAKAALRVSEERYELALAASGAIGTWDWDIVNDRVYANRLFAELYSVEPDVAVAGVPVETFVEGIHPDDRDRVNAAIRRCLNAQGDFAEEYRLAQRDGRVFWVFARGKCHFDDAGKPIRFPGATIDITDRKLAEEALAHKTRALEILNSSGALLAAELDLEKVVQTVTDKGVELIGAEFGAFFYNVVSPAGESYRLYALSGAPREAFDQFPMPRNTRIFAPTFSGERIVRIADVLHDPLYSGNPPYDGMPQGHLPVRSYLAAPVKSPAGEVLGGLLFGHGKPDMFGPETEDAMAGLATQAAIAIDRARLFDASQQEILHRAQIETDLHQLNTTLEQRVVAEVAERAKAEDALRQAQKMEAVGQLTGGVAHDFNNLLTVIIGGLDTILRIGDTDPARQKRAAEMALQGAQRAASLTARLLAFSRRQPLQPTVVELNVLVRDMTELLHRTLGETVELEAMLTPRLWPVEVDPNQLESAILNLAVNARDAMPGGGKLTIETANTELDENYAAMDAEVRPGQYVAISVSDDGDGMSAEIIRRVFEPFFTTKDVGKGTGLGLPMVYGFVKQSGGHVTIYSEEGEGTTIKLYLPRHLGDHSAIKPQPLIGPAGQGNEVILVVEDNDDVRAYSVMILTELGYEVLEAADADQALILLEKTPQIQLLFTDVVLPGKSGRVLADAAAVLRPDLPVLFTTGYSRNAIVHQGRLDAGVRLITKPFTFEQLAARVRDILDDAQRN